MTEQERQEMLAEMRGDKEGGSKKYWSPGANFEGTKTIRFLPPLKKLNEKKFYFSHRTHFIGGSPFEDLDQTILDENGNIIHEAQFDPVSSLVKKLYRTAEKNSEEWKLAGLLNARQRFISRIIVRDKENPTNELQPVFYEYGPTVYDILFHIMTETDFGVIVDPKEGRDFNLTKRGIARQSKYDTSTPAAVVTPIFKEVERLKVMFDNAMRMPYSSLLTFPTFDEKERALKEFLGNDVSKEPAKVYDMAPKKTITKTASASPVVEDTSSDEDDDIDAILNDMV